MCKVRCFFFFNMQDSWEVEKLILRFRQKPLMRNLECNAELNSEERLKIFSSKSSENTEDGVPFNSLFVLSRYLYPLPRYNDSKFNAKRQKLWMGARPTDLHIFPEMRTLFFQESRLSPVWTVWDRSVKRGASERSE